MRTLEKVAIGAPATVGVNLGIQYVVAGGLPKFSADQGRGLNARSAAAAGLGLAASAGSLAVFGPVPAILGAAESLGFLLTEFLTAPKAVEQTAAPAPAPAPVSAPKQTTTQKIVSAASQYLPRVLPAANQLFQSLLGQPDLMVVRSRR